MDPLIVLIILFAAILVMATTIIGVLAYVIACVALWCFETLLAFALVAYGTVNDAWYDRRVARGEKPFRLPFAYRWKGWRVGDGGERTGYGRKYGMYYDPKRRRIIPMTRRTRSY